MAKPPAKEDPKAIQRAREMLQSLTWVKHSVVLEAARKRRFWEEAERRKIPLKYALDEALADWIEKGEK